MEHITLEAAKQTDLTIMIFAEGTILKPKSWFRLYDHNSYQPIGNCVEIIKGWQEQGATIVYCTSRKARQAEAVADLLRKYGFVGSELYYRSRKETYKAIIERVRPAVLIEDDCKSIGGAWQMCITKVDPTIKEQIVSVVVEEFQGIDDLPRKVSTLMQH